MRQRTAPSAVSHKLRISGPASVVGGVFAVVFSALAYFSGEATAAAREQGFWRAKTFSYSRNCDGGALYVGGAKIRAVSESDARRHLLERNPGCQFRLDRS
jgi:hypothetical protein